MSKRQSKISAEGSQMKAFLASKAVDQVSDYCRRGRMHCNVSDEELVRLWKTIWSDLAADPLSEAKRDIQGDIAAEFSLRNKEPPWELVEEQTNSVLVDSDRAADKWQKENPGAHMEANEALNDELRAFVARRQN